MSPEPTAPPPVNDLAVKKAIDTACDRFESAWLTGQRPRIESYLAPIAPLERPLYVRELLLTELALRPTANPQAARQECLERFPEYSQVVLEVFAQFDSQQNHADSPTPPRDLDRLISAVRGRLATPASLSPRALEDSDTIPQGLSDPGCGTAQALWRSLAGHAGLSTAGGVDARSQRAARLERVANELLGAFPASRRPILSSLLQGSSFAGAAALHGVTQRTVEATYRAALELLSGGETAHGA